MHVSSLLLVDLKMAARSEWKCLLLGEMRMDQGPERLPMMSSAPVALQQHHCSVSILINQPFTLWLVGKQRRLLRSSPGCINIVEVVFPNCKVLCNIVFFYANSPLLKRASMIIKKKNKQWKGKCKTLVIVVFFIFEKNMRNDDKEE